MTGKATTLRLRPGMAVWNRPDAGTPVTRPRANRTKQTQFRDDWLLVPEQPEMSNKPNSVRFGPARVGPENVKQSQFRHFSRKNEGGDKKRTQFASSGGVPA